MLVCFVIIVKIRVVLKFVSALILLLSSQSYVIAAFFGELCSLSLKKDAEIKREPNK